MRDLQTPYHSQRSDWLHAATVAIALFALYAATAPRTVALEDDSLFVLSSYFLGIEHPPGYPIFTMIGHLFSLLPFGSVAYRVHLASALFGALTGAALWLCARALVRGRVAAYLAAFGLGLSPVFWSQSIIAEVYSLNTTFFLVLVYLGLRTCPPSWQPRASPEQLRRLYWMAFLFGLSLSNHYPLMLLVAPGFAVLLWPMRRELLARLGVLSWLVIAGLLPYAWLVARSWSATPISFDGPLETLPEFFFFVSRAGYEGIDRSVSADALDRIKFFEFLGGQLVLQFAVVGTALAAAGCAVQWRVLGHRLSAFLTIAFIMPSFVLLLLLGFDYSSVSKHIFHVYPLPAYAVVALWMALGFEWIVGRYALRFGHAAAASVAVLALIFAVGTRTNLFASHDWGARYAQVLLKILPRDAAVFGQGEADLGPLAYFHMIEGQRPDLTLYQTKGLLLGSRLFHPLRTDEKTADRILSDMIKEQTVPVVSTLDVFGGYGRKDRWLYAEVDKSSHDAAKVTVDIPEEAIRFFEQSIAGPDDRNVWVAFFQRELRRNYALLLTRSLPRGRVPEPRVARHLELLAKDYAGSLGMAEGLMLNQGGYSVGAVAGLLEQARRLMPSDATKADLARFFHLRGVLRADQGDLQGAIQDLETEWSVWPHPENLATGVLEDLYKRTGEARAAEAVRARAERLKRTKR